jgi:hypothetical protein
MWMESDVDNMKFRTISILAIAAVLLLTSCKSTPTANSEITTPVTSSSNINTSDTTTPETASSDINTSDTAEIAHKLERENRMEILKKLFPDAPTSQKEVEEKYGVKTTLADKEAVVKIPDETFDYDLFKSLFFGKWTAENNERNPLEINDDTKFRSYKALGTDETMKIGTLYKFSDNVTGILCRKDANNGGMTQLYLIDKTDPNTLYYHGDPDEGEDVYNAGLIGIYPADAIYHKEK